MLERWFKHDFYGEELLLREEVVVCKEQEGRAIEKYGLYFLCGICSYEIAHFTHLTQLS
jgi:hypothetical protein